MVGSWAPTRTVGAYGFSTFARGRIVGEAEEGAKEADIRRTVKKADGAGRFEGRVDATSRPHRGRIEAASWPRGHVGAHIEAASRPRRGRVARRPTDCPLTAH